MDGPAAPASSPDLATELGLLPVDRAELEQDVKLAFDHLRRVYADHGLAGLTAHIDFLQRVVDGDETVPDLLFRQAAEHVIEQAEGSAASHSEGVRALQKHAIEAQGRAAVRLHLARAIRWRAALGYTPLDMEESEVAALFGALGDKLVRKRTTVLNAALLAYVFVHREGQTHADMEQPTEALRTALGVEEARISEGNLYSSLSRGPRELLKEPAIGVDYEPGSFPSFRRAVLDLAARLGLSEDRLRDLDPADNPGQEIERVVANALGVTWVSL